MTSNAAESKPHSGKKMFSPFRIKICGVTRCEDAEQAVESGADAIGLNFYAKSPRYVNTERAKEIGSAARPGKLVGVFVNHNSDSINQIAASVGLDFVQLHGDETPSMVSQIDRPVIRVVRIAKQQFGEASTNAATWKSASASAILLDAASGQHYGGTGQKLDWDCIASLEIELPLILAGGLNPDNVAQAIAVAGPYGVDVASGVEQRPGIKDQKKMQTFIENARTAFDSAL